MTLQKAGQATLFVVATPSTVAFGSTSALSTTGGSGTGAVTFSAGASTGCSVAGSTLSVIDASGSCSVTATKAADANYNVATSAALPVTLVKANQAPLTVIVPSNLTYPNTAVLSTTGGSGTGAVTYSVGASTACSVAGDILSVTNIDGTCNVTATKAADNNYNETTVTINGTVTGGIALFIGAVQGIGLREPRRDVFPLEPQAVLQSVQAEAQTEWQPRQPFKKCPRLIIVMTLLHRVRKPVWPEEINTGMAT